MVLVSALVYRLYEYSVGHGPGYGFPSSHSQFMAYFSTFLICHLYFQHRPSSTGSVVFDRLLRLCAYLGLLAWTGSVAFSRYGSVVISYFKPSFRSAGITYDTMMPIKSCGAFILGPFTGLPFTCLLSLYRGVGRHLFWVDLERF